MCKRGPTRSIGFALGAPEAPGRSIPQGPPRASLGPDQSKKHRCQRVLVSRPAPYCPATWPGATFAGLTMRVSRAPENICEVMEANFRSMWSTGLKSVSFACWTSGVVFGGRSGHCSGWPGDLVPGPWRSIPGPGRVVRRGPGGPRTL